MLNRIQPSPGFVYDDIRLTSPDGQLTCQVQLRAHEQIQGKCSICLVKAPGYDRLPERSWLFVPPWQIPTYLRYAPRRANCAEHGVVVEHISWSEGKRPITTR